MFPPLPPDFGGEKCVDKVKHQWLQVWLLFFLTRSTLASSVFLFEAYTSETGIDSRSAVLTVALSVVSKFLTLAPAVAK